MFTIPAKSDWHRTWRRYARPTTLAKDPCLLPSIHRIQVPLYPDRANSPKWTFAYQAIIFDRRLPTIILPPGGPGGGLIADWTSPEMASDVAWFGLPKNTNYVFLDPRGTGCNEKVWKNLPDDGLKTEYLAYDAILAIRDLKLKSFYIYGESYGTTWGTVLAGMLEKLGTPSLGLIMTGVFSRPVPGFENSIADATIKGWNRIKGQLPAKAVAKLSVDKPLGIDNDTWESFIESGLRGGRDQDAQGNLFNYVRTPLSLLESDDPKVIEQVRKTVLGGNGGGITWPFANSDRVFNTIFCQELGTEASDLGFYKGNLFVKPNTNSCTGIPMNRPLDIRRWPISEPIYYLQGMADPACPYKYNTFYHAQVEFDAPRFMMLAPDWGHDFIGGLFKDCVEDIWDSIFHDGRNFENVFKRCRAPSYTKVFKPGE
jgi:pimeloyl-ACP methyl ester carboxylesterase